MTMSIKKGQIVTLRADMLEAGEANLPHVALEDSFNGVVRVELAGDYPGLKPVNDWRVEWIAAGDNAGETTMKVQPGVHFYHRSAEPGSGLMKVLRRHRDVGHWECVHLDGPRKLSIWVRSTWEIEDDLARVANAGGC